MLGYAILYQVTNAHEMSQVLCVYTTHACTFPLYTIYQLLPIPSILFFQSRPTHNVLFSMAFVATLGTNNSSDMYVAKLFL